MSTTPSSNPQHAPALALVALLEILPEIPDTAPLLERGMWNVQFGEVKGSLHSARTVAEPFGVLRALADRLGGSIRPDGRPFAGYDNRLTQMHALTTTFMDVPVTIRVAVAAESEVEQLRAKIAELEARVSS